MFYSSSRQLGLLIALSACSTASAVPVSPDPVVDLGYGLYQGHLNQSGNYYNFSNIRFGQAPVGNLRFARPKPPLVNRSVVNDGQDGRICPQAVPNWIGERTLWLKDYPSNPDNTSVFTQEPPPGAASKPVGQMDGRATEDCLFLDVLVPESLYNNHSTNVTGTNSTGGAPVMVYAYGGGYLSGYKGGNGNPANLLQRSMSNPQTSPGVIWVQMNYRLGALGWLAGPTFAAEGGTSNAGLYDLSLALEWIQRYIHLYGGDPGRVTLMGESSGAAMTVYQITAYGGAQGDARFQQAYINSPASTPQTSAYRLEEYYQQFLGYANATSLADLRNLSSGQAITAMELMAFHAPYGVGNTAAVVDGLIIPQLASQLLAQGRFAKNVRSVVASHNSDEGLYFVNPDVQNNSAYNSYLSGFLLPQASPEALDYVTGTLYPPIFNESSFLGYNDTVGRAALTFGDYLINCNVGNVLSAVGNNSYGFLFDVGLGTHSEDSGYLFYGGPAEDEFTGKLENSTLAGVIQDWLLNFGGTGNPNASSSLDPIPLYRENRSLALISDRGLGINVADPATKERCDFWGAGLYT